MTSSEQVVDGVREAPREGALHAAVNHLVQPWVLEDALELLLDSNHELVAESLGLILIPLERTVEVSLRLWGEKGVRLHRRPRIRALTSGQGETASGFRR